MRHGKPRSTRNAHNGTAARRGHLPLRRGVMAWHLEPPYRALGYRLPQTERAAAECLQLRMHSGMTEARRSVVLASIDRVCGRNWAKSSNSSAGIHCSTRTSGEAANSAGDECADDFSSSYAVLPHPRLKWCPRRPTSFASVRLARIINFFGGPSRRQGNCRGCYCTEEAQVRPTPW